MLFQERHHIGLWHEVERLSSDVRPVRISDGMDVRALDSKSLPICWIVPRRAVQDNWRHQCCGKIYSDVRPVNAPDSIYVMALLLKYLWSSSSKRDNVPICGIYDIK